MGKLDGKVAVITGGSSGIGRATALALAAEGAAVAIGGRKASALAEVKAAITSTGGRAISEVMDVRDETQVAALVDSAVQQFGRVDILGNNAGILRDKTIHNMTDEMWDLVIAVHLRGTFACTRAAARVMKEKGAGGRIINTTSMAGLKGNFGQSNYSAAKAAIYGLTLTAAMELGKDGITVNAIAPLAKTRMTQEIESIPAEYRPEDVSPVVVFLASDLAKDVTGRIFGVHGRRLFEYRMEMTAGREKKEPWMIEEISSFVHAPSETAPPAAASSGGVGRIAAVFKALPSAFDAEKSAGWETVMHFAVAGAGDWTVEVKDKKTRVSEGKPAAPTCVITVDAETLAGMVEGKIKGDMAFMSGKLKATKVPDLAKFGKAFDFKKLQAAPADAVRSVSVDLPALLERLPARFLSDKAAGFNGTLLFKVDGQAAMVEIKDKACRVAPPVATPTCTLTTDGGTLAGILDGSLDGQKAFSEGKIKATHLPSWMKFRQIFKFEPERGLRRSLIGHRYGGGALLVRPEKMAAYDDAVGDKDSLIFPVTLVKELFVKFIEDTEFNGDLARMVHGEQLFYFHRSIKAWDLISPRGCVVGIEDKSSGQILSLDQRLYCEGELGVVMESRLFFRGESKGEKAPANPPPTRPPPSSQTQVIVPTDLPARYAAASGDRNPIHVDKAFAQSAGFRDVILHGLGTLALVATALPKNLARLQVRFAKPVYPGDVLTTSFWRSDGRIEFETVNPAGEIVLANGLAVARG
jgi:NAD(P)-dependent dehydrogenase (short-subunit alcohol dehydrogenase family)/acyl dehydratase/putative sterol carrier protein